MVWTHAENGKKNEVTAVGDMRVPGKRPRGVGWIASEGYVSTADRPGGCTGQNILEIKNWSR